MKPRSVSPTPVPQSSPRVGEELARQRFSTLAAAVREHHARGRKVLALHWYDAELYRRLGELEAES